MQALVTAYASGQLSPTAAQMLAHALVISDASPRWLVGDLFTAMAKNPAAAANFMAALSSQDLQTLALDGGMTQAGSDGVMRDVLATATAAVQTGDSDQAHSVFATVTDAFANFHSANPMSDTKAIQDFVSAYVAAIQTAPPYDPDPQKMADELSLWAARQGHNVSDALQPFVTWLKANDSNNAQVQTTTISLVSGIVGTVLTLPFGGVGALAAGTVTTVLQTYVEPTVQSQLLHITPPDPAGDAAALRAAGTAAAKALVAVDLARQGMLIGPDGKPLDLNGPEGAKTLATLLKAGSDYNAIAGWHVKGTDYSLFTVLALVGDQFDGAPNQLPPA
jgi:hypothetical protein